MGMEHQGIASFDASAEVCELAQGEGDAGRVDQSHRSGLPAVTRKASAWYRSTGGERGQGGCAYGGACGDRGQAVCARDRGVAASGKVRSQHLRFLPCLRPTMLSRILRLFLEGETLV